MIRAILQSFARSVENRSKLDDLIEKQDKIAKRVLELEKKKKAVATKGNKEYKFIDISEGETKK